jgi:hypothetical protein
MPLNNSGMVGDFVDDVGFGLVAKLWVRLEHRTYEIAKVVRLNVTTRDLQNADSKGLLNNNLYNLAVGCFMSCGVAECSSSLGGPYAF